MECVYCPFESNGASASPTTPVVADLDVATVLAVVTLVVLVVVVVVIVVVVSVFGLGFFALEDDDDDKEYITVPRSTRLDPTAISNPKPFSKYNTEINSELNLRRLRMKFSVNADDNDVSRWTPEIHINLSTISETKLIYALIRNVNHTREVMNWLQNIAIKTYCVKVLTAKKIQSRGIVIELNV